jgi:hypothetical protein
VRSPSAAQRLQHRLPRLHRPRLAVAALACWIIRWPATVAAPPPRRTAPLPVPVVAAMRRRNHRRHPRPPMVRRTPRALQLLRLLPLHPSCRLRGQRHVHMHPVPVVRRARVEAALAVIILLCRRP